MEPPGMALEPRLPLKADGKAALARAINDELEDVPRADGSPSWLNASPHHRTLAKRIQAKIGGKPSPTN
jgi:hypothetical protein